jgi:hypothetical protein
MKTSTTKLMFAVAVLLVPGIIISTSKSNACECIVSGETKSATIEFSGETHCYTFLGEAGQGIVIQMADDDAVWPPRVQLYDPYGVQVAEAVDGSYPYTYAAIENYQLETTGTYTIVTSYSGGVSEYGLSLVLTGGTMTSFEDRDGGDVTPSAAQNGTITPHGDTDIYAFCGQVSQGIMIEMADDDATWPPRVQLYDPNGVRVIEAVDESYPYTYTAIEDYQLEMEGIYTIVASYSGGTGDYGLSVSVMPPNDPNGLYPYGPAPIDGDLVDLCYWDTLSWWPVDGATDYDVYFSDSPCKPLEKVSENTANPFLPMPAVEDGQFCSWRVVAHTTNGDIRGATWWFVAEPCISCALNISAIGLGSIVESNIGLNSYSCGEVVSVTAVADINYEFVRWEGTAVDANKIVVEYQDYMGSKIQVIVDGAYTLKAVFEEIIYDFPLDSDPEWMMEGQWEFGIPTGQGGDEHGNPDPTSGYTGENVIGVNLNGDYDTTITEGPNLIIAGPLDLSNYDDVRLRFWRWLNTDESRYVSASVGVSTDQMTWRNLWESGTEIMDSQWALVEYDLGAEADGQPEVYVKWSYQVLAERAYPYSGWNIDDIELIGCRDGCQ